ncbi:hypothetical protein PVAND_004121 [Polypedilum vanderplanki]|uniref:Uncharacterized protein n=1 Tax=Polypedilum vanderplanki TaxID=319348 RepID=A0A9J6BWR2_POLVA|nr:hypothetical protein PVAND_004121 [Polypedilum vanderplanki]
MIQSRAILLSRIISNHLKTKGLQKQQVCHSGTWNYRSGPDVSSYPAWVRYGSTGVAGLMWWWVLWHIWHDLSTLLVNGQNQILDCGQIKNLEFLQTMKNRQEIFSRK